MTKKLIKSTKFSLSVLFILITFITFSQTHEPDCKILRNGKFKYLDVEDTSGYIIIKDTLHVEYHNNNKYYIKSKLTWLSDCSYLMTMTDITIPNFPFHTGDIMEVDVTKIEDGIIYYNSIINNASYPGRLKILDK
jgi:hypothetical protein